MEDIILILTVGTICMACFFIGAKVGQTVSKGENIKMPNVDPFNLYREHQDIKKAEKEQAKQEIITQNIERYDGTPNGQIDVPR